MTDPLNDLISLMRPRAVLWKRIEGSGRWAIRFRANGHVNLGMVAAGRCLLVGLGEPLELVQGDFLLLSAPPAFTFTSGTGVTPVAGESALADAAENEVSLGSGVEGAASLIAGHFVLDAANANLLLDLLPDVVHLRAADSGTERISRLVDLAVDEAVSDLPGTALILERLAEVMLVEALRSHTPTLGRQPRGLLGGLGDPQIAAALKSMHADVRHAWTVAELAAAARLSRSVFAERFTERVGTTPISYLLAWRMALAREALARGDQTIAEVARAVGYGSASAFSIAFHRFVGSPPSRYAAVTDSSRPA